MSKRTKYDKPSGFPAKYRGDRGMGKKGEDYYEEHSGHHKPIVGASLEELERRLKELDDNAKKSLDTGTPPDTVTSS